jgi:virginiamycin B lyase
MSFDEDGNLYGNVWYTARVPSTGRDIIGRLNPTTEIGRMTLTGTFTEYPLPTANSSPLGLTADIDGNHLWFTEANTNRVARIDQGGQILEIDVPTPDSLPQALRAGPNGKIYFVERKANKIGRVNR